MGSLINKVKVVCDLDNKKDKVFIFTINTDGTEADINETVNKALAQKVREGELESVSLRKITIKSDDERGIFSSFLGDVEGLLKSL